ncbi:hypothetical protein [Methylobacterium nigriterrae]|uniref:hypothetical protein n=1 Tax=Methylobacterium nigriterrae TaxID=3127512 RepID=UPI00301370D1
MSPSIQSSPTVLELIEAGAVKPEAITSLAETYLATPGLRVHTLAFGWMLDVAEAIATHPLARAIIGSSLVSPRAKRTMIATAIMLARPMRL